MQEFAEGCGAQLEADTIALAAGAVTAMLAANAAAVGPLDSPEKVLHQTLGLLGCLGYCRLHEDGFDSRACQRAQSQPQAKLQNGLAWCLRLFRDTWARVGGVA